MLLAGSDPENPSWVDLSDDTERAMWGVDLGVRWEAGRVVRLDGGWRYRDWQHDGGPASFSGPFVRLVVHF